MLFKKKNVYMYIYTYHIYIYIYDLCIQIIPFTQCVGILGEVKYNQLPADFAVATSSMSKEQNDK